MMSRRLSRWDNSVRPAVRPGLVPPSVLGLSRSTYTRPISIYLHWSLTSHWSSTTVSIPKSQIGTYLNARERPLGAWGAAQAGVR